MPAALSFMAGPGRKSGHFSARAEVFGGFGQEIGHFSARAGGMDGFFGGREFCWERGRVPLFQKLEFRELFAEVGAVGEGDGVDAEGLGGGDICGVVVDEDAVGGSQ